MYGYTFRQLWERGEETTFSPALRAIRREMERLDRSYLRDNLHPSSEGNYLQDFLEVHGDENASPITVSREYGRMFVSILDMRVERRRIEERLRKSEEFLGEVWAAQARTPFVGT